MANRFTTSDTERITVARLALWLSTRDIGTSRDGSRDQKSHELKQREARRGVQVFHLQTAEPLNPNYPVFDEGVGIWRK